MRGKACHVARHGRFAGTIWGKRSQACKAETRCGGRTKIDADRVREICIEMKNWIHIFGRTFSQLFLLDFCGGMKCGDSKDLPSRYWCAYGNLSYNRIAEPGFVLKWGARESMCDDVPKVCVECALVERVNLSIYEA